MNRSIPGPLPKLMALVLLASIAAVGLPAQSAPSRKTDLIVPGGLPTSGYDVVIIDDIDGNGGQDVAVSEPTPGLLGSGPAVGGVKVFDGATRQVLWNYVAPMFVPHRGFIAAIPDRDQDGVRDLVLVQGYTGLTSLLFLSGATGTSATLPLLTLPASEAFARAVPFRDVNGDAVLDYVVGGRSIAQVIDGATGAALQSLTFPTASGGFVSEYHHRHLQITADRDLTGDGIPDILCGCPTSFFDQFESGGVILYSGADYQEVWRRSGNGANSNFGGALLTVEDVDGDGRTDVLVGQPRAYTETGRVHLLSGANGFTLWSSGAPSGATISPFRQFGASLAAFQPAGGAGAETVLITCRPESPQPGVRELIAIEGRVTATGLEIQPHHRTFHLDGNHIDQYATPYVRTGGDLNADLADDVVVGFSNSILAVSSNAAPGWLHLFRSRAAGNYGSIPALVDRLLIQCSRSVDKLAVSGAAPNAQGLLLIGISPAAMPFGGGTVLVEWSLPGSWFLLPFPFDAQGVATLDLSGTALPSTVANPFVGQTFYAQAFTLDAPPPLAAFMSAGIQVTF